MSLFSAFKIQITILCYQFSMHFIFLFVVCVALTRIHSSLFPVKFLLQMIFRMVVESHSTFIPFFFFFFGVFFSTYLNSFHLHHSSLGAFVFIFTLSCESHDNFRKTIECPTYRVIIYTIMTCTPMWMVNCGWHIFVKILLKVNSQR